jgi:hypothetical protein
MIRDHNRDRGVEPPVTDGVDQRLQIASTPGNQHAEAPVNGVGGHLTRTLLPQPGMAVAFSNPICHDIGVPTLRA